MKRNWKLAACLLLALVTLSACSSQPDPNDFPDITQAIGPTPSPAPSSLPILDEPIYESDGESIFSANPYDDFADFTAADALDEEDYVDPEYGVEDNFAYSYSQPAGTPYAYAGSTPIPLNPVDMPTPTPRPKLSFTYTPYTASTVGVTFEGPSGWQVDQSQSYLFVLSEPQTQIKDNQQCIITISAEPVSTYTKRELETHVTQRLNTIGGGDFTEWKPSYTATRHMMGQTGVYANYTGMYSDGTEVGGRIHYVSIDNVLYGLEIVYPLGFKDDYINVFGQIRSSMTRVR